MKIMKLIARGTLFVFVLVLGVALSLLAGEQKGLTRNDLSIAPISATYIDATYNAYYAIVKENPSLSPGIYRSQNKGYAWHLVAGGPPLRVSALAVDPLNEATLFAGTVGGSDPQTGRLWRSTDGGRSWHQYGLGLPLNSERQAPTISALAVDPAHPGLLYVGTEGQGLYRFDLNGSGYERFGGPQFPDLYIKKIVANPEGGLYLLTTGSGLVRIEGDTWRSFEALPGHAINLALSPTDPETLYVGTLINGVYHSSDGGQTWRALNTGLDLTPGFLTRVTAITIDEQNTNHLALATAHDIGRQTAPGGIYESHDGGQSWVRLADAQKIVSDLSLQQDGIYATTSEGLVFFGELPSPTTTLPQSVAHQLVNPTQIQVTVWLLTAFLAIVVLLGRFEWFRFKKASAHIDDRHRLSRL